MAPRSARMSTVSKRKGNEKKSPPLEAKVSKKKRKVKEKSEVAVSTRRPKRRPEVTTTESKNEIPLPLSYNKHDLRVVIRFLCASGMTTAEIDRMLRNVYGRQSTSFTNVFRWCRQFRNGRANLEDEKRSGRPLKVKLSDKSDEILNYIKVHRHATHRQIGFHMKLSYTTMFKFIRETLKYRLFLGCWVPVQLSEENREKRVKFSTVNLARCKSESQTTFINRIVVADQSWVYFHTTPLNKRPPPLKNEQGQVIKRKKELRLKWTTETGPSPAVALFMTVFWDCTGVVAIDFKDPETLSSSSPDGFRYSDKSSLQMLYDQVCTKRPGLLQTGLTLLMNEDLSSEEKKVVDDAAGETITSRLTSFGWQGLFNPANSPDLSPSDYHLFLPLKKHVSGKRFADADAGKRCVVEWLWAQDPGFFANGLQDLVTRWERCIKVKGEYLNK